MRGVDSELIRIVDCAHGCDRFRKWRIGGRHEFRLPPYRDPRHLFSDPAATYPRFNREYLPHLAAHTRAVFEFKYSAASAVFSSYRAFSRDLLSKRRGQGFELDSLFYTASGKPSLHIEAKRDPREIATIAEAINRFAELEKLPPRVAKEVEYVLEVKPQFFWLVGPGTVDPARHVWRVWVNEQRAVFEPIASLPPAEL